MYSPVFANAEDVVYRNGFGSGWKHYGWAPHEFIKGGSAKINFEKWGGWIIAAPNTEKRGDSLTFSMTSTKFPDFISVTLGGDDGDVYEKATLSKKFLKDSKNKTYHFSLPLSELNPDWLPFNKIRFKAIKKLGPTWISINNITIHSSGIPRKKTEVAAVNKVVKETITCNSPTKSISPYIYGIAYSPRKAYSEKHIKELNSPIRRWGGNPASRYNWKLGNAWNTGADWFYRNVNYTPNRAYTWKEFFEENISLGASSAVTIPLLGWVAKDTRSYSFPVSVYGKQQKVAPENSDFGNGFDPAGKPIENTSPSRTSLKVDEKFWKGWIDEIKKLEKKKKQKLVDTYFLGNEPMLWNSTHRDVHPEGASYQEVYEKTISYSKMIRSAAPKALIAGPTLWGWTAYMFSAKDGETGYRLRLDRRKHGDVPFLEWYLKELRSYEKTKGHKSIDILDIHYYPQSKGIYGKANSRKIADLRVRSVQSLWNPQYTDESWIDEPIYLLPRMQQMINQHYPGLKLSIGEYNFGGERHMSGAIALAETLGLLGRYGVYSAYYWTYPPNDSPTMRAFQLFRNYDQKNSVYLDQLMDSKVGQNYSYFASTNQNRSKVTMIFINKTREEQFTSQWDFEGCGKLTSQKLYSVNRGSKNIDLQVQQPDKQVVFPPWSVSLVEWTMKN